MGMNLKKIINLKSKKPERNKRKFSIAKSEIPPPPQNKIKFQIPQLKNSQFCRNSQPAIKNSKMWIPQSVTQNLNQQPRSKI